MGTLSFKQQKIIMKPSMIIGSDRMELYEFFGRRREVWGLQNKNWLKFATAMTAVHFLTVSVP